ncbi:hypothetical protein [Noviherbaspirillum galbum]|uniref:Lipoprotein n=1 Tax=Noviherbaspirillum galbum TaxID=2709383 RepID=A0A6B3SX93_9BURK|nr:hypothetical protein [Noviherbaspirillum galbum]NEX64145.1 hypothetical protein [Noviherbaspirillum galbum]
MNALPGARLALAALLGALLAACGGGAGGPTLAPADFVAMAKTAECRDLGNRLFLIDDSFVFWDVSGSCPDLSPVRKLFGKTPSDQLCSQTGKPVGVVTVCSDASAIPMFHAILDHLDLPDLGLGPSHRVQAIPFQNQP